MVTREKSPSRVDQKPPQRFWRRARWAIPLGAGIVMAAWAIRAAITLDHDVKTIQSAVPTMRQAVARQDWPALNRGAVAIRTAAMSARRVVNAARVLSVLPAVGGPYRRLGALTAALSNASQALVTMLPSAEKIWPTVSHPSLSAPASSALWTMFTADLSQSGPDWLKIARALKAVDGWAPFRAYPIRSWAAGAEEMGRIAGEAKIWAALLGLTHGTRYLVLFQDSGELRATGGFLSGYGYLNLNRGRVGIAGLNGILSLSRDARAILPAPWVLQHFFGATRLTLINANLSPNLPTASRVVETLYRTVPDHPPVAGVLWVNTWMADRLLTEVGPVSITAGGHAFRLDGSHPLVANVTMERLAYQYGEPGTVAVLSALSAGLSKIIDQGSARQKWRLVQMVAWGIQHQDLVLYSNRPQLEHWLSTHGLGGQMPGGAENFMEVVNDNFGGHKDNLYLRQHVTIEPDGDRRERITVSERLPISANGWLVVPYRGWMTLYLPAGTRVLTAAGIHPRVSRDPALDKTVVGFNVSIPASRELGKNRFQGEVTIVLPTQIAHPNELRLSLQPGQSGQMVTVGTRTFWQAASSTVTLSAPTAPPGA
jgi:hypothetical protein